MVEVKIHHRASVSLPSASSELFVADSTTRLRLRTGGGAAFEYLEMPNNLKPRENIMQSDVRQATCGWWSYFKHGFS